MDSAVGSLQLRLHSTGRQIQFKRSKGIFPPLTSRTFGRFVYTQFGMVRRFLAFTSLFFFLED